MERKIYNVVFMSGGSEYTELYLCADEIRVESVKGFRYLAFYRGEDELIGMFNAEWIVAAYRTTEV